MEAAFKGIVQRVLSAAVKHLHNLQLRVMPPGVDLVAQTLGKLTVLEYQASWKARLCTFLQGGWIGACEGQQRKELLVLSFQ